MRKFNITHVLQDGTVRDSMEGFVISPDSPGGGQIYRVAYEILTRKEREQINLSESNQGKEVNDNENHRRRNDREGW